MSNFLTTIPIAHRGLHSEGVPENSMAAFRAAIVKHYAIETDIRLTKDNELVIFHDDNLLRMAKIDKRIRDCTLAQLQSVRLAGTQETIPSFKQFLDEVSGLTPLLIEIKNVPEAKSGDYIKRVAAALEGYRGEYAVQSFQPFLVKKFKKLRPDIPCGILATAEYQKSDFGGGFLWRIKGLLVKNMSFNDYVKPEFISYRLEDYPQEVTEEFEGIKLAWVARFKEQEEHVRAYADNIIFEDYFPEHGVVSPCSNR